MKRWVVVVLVTLAVLVLVSPGIIGRMAERNLAESIERASLTSPELTISTERFERDWFSSEGRHRIEFTDRDAFPVLAEFAGQAGSSSMPALIIDTHIDHGLLPVGSVSHEDGSLAPGIASLISTLQFDPGNGALIDIPGKVVSSVGLAGETNSHLALEQGSWSEDDVSLQWQGTDLHVSLDANGFLTAANGSVEPLELAAGELLFGMGETRLQLQRDRGAYQLVNGSLDFQSSNLSLAEGQGSRTGVAALSVVANNSVTNEALSGGARIEVEDARSSAPGSYSMQLEFEYEGLDAASFASLLIAYNDAVDRGAADPVGSLYPAMESEIQKLLSRGSSIRVKQLDVSMPQGQLTSDLSMTLPAVDSDGPLSLPGLLLKLQATVNLRMPDELVELMVAMQPDFTALIGLGFLIKRGNDYEMKLEVNQGMATVNGAPMPLSAIAGF